MRENTLNIKSEDLNEAIRKAANEHLLKRQTLSKPQATITTTTNISTSNQQQQSIKSELERALDARLKRSSMITAATDQQPPSASLSATSLISSSQKHDLPPPPSPLSLHRLSKTQCGPPPPPPMPSDLFKQTGLNQPVPPVVTKSKSSFLVSQQIDKSNNVDTTTTTNVRTIANHMQISSTDPRLSSDFSALIGMYLILGKNKLILQIFRALEKFVRPPLKFLGT